MPTAIQLYDLQDRLGLTQPSKVIDWLIDATKHEIDKLPPLPMLPTNFLHYFHQPCLPTTTTTTSSSSSPYNNNNHYSTSHLRWWNNINTTSAASSHVDAAGFVPQLSTSTAHNFFPLNSQFSVPNMMHPYNSNYFQLDDTTTTTPNLSLSQFGGGFSDHHHHHPLSNCTLSSSSSSQQIYMSPSATSITPFATYINAESHDDDREFRQINHYQNSVLMPTTLHLINSPIKSFTSLLSNPNDQTQKQDQDRSTC